MQPSPTSASSQLPGNGESPTRSRTKEDLTYQAVTVAAIFLLLASLWLF